MQDVERVLGRVLVELDVARRHPPRLERDELRVGGRRGRLGANELDDHLRGEYMHEERVPRGVEEASESEAVALHEVARVFTPSETNAAAYTGRLAVKSCTL